MHKSVDKLIGLLSAPTLRPEQRSDGAYLSYSDIEQIHPQINEVDIGEDVQKLRGEVCIRTAARKDQSGWSPVATDRERVNQGRNLRDGALVDYGQFSRGKTQTYVCRGRGTLRDLYRCDAYEAAEPVIHEYLHQRAATGRVTGDRHRTDRVRGERARESVAAKRNIERGTGTRLSRQDESRCYGDRIARHTATAVPVSVRVMLK